MGLRMATYIGPFFLTLCLVLIPALSFAQTKSDILVLGDSQISFGAGEVYLDFFHNIERNCANTLSKAQLNGLGQRRTLAVGVRSTSLDSWVARDGEAKDTICEVDKNYGVNAGVYGIGGRSDRKFIQIGKEPGFQYCQKDKSAFEGVFDDPANTPKLLVLNFLGNAGKRWSESQIVTDMDVRRTLRQLPEGGPCIVLTTAPVFEKSTNNIRMSAQSKLAIALAKAPGRCQLVKGFTLATRRAIEGKPRFFRRDENGNVVDPHHPSKAAIKQLMTLISPKLCKAIATALE